MISRKRRQYKSYEETGGIPPRQTLHSRGRKVVKTGTLQQPNVEPVPEGAEVEQVDYSAHGPVDPTPTTQVLPQPDKTVKFKKKRKVNTARDHCQETDRNTGSSDDLAASSDSAPETDQSCSVHDSETHPIVRQVVPLHENNVFEAECSYDCQDDPPASRDNSEESEPLCPCTKTTVGDILFMTLSLGLRHGLTWAAQVDILKMFTSIFCNKKIPLSKPTFLKMLNAVNRSDIEYRVYCKNYNTFMGRREEWERFCGVCNKSYEDQDDGEFVEYCTDCNNPLQERQVKGKLKSCPNEICEKNVKSSVTDNLLVSVSIESQLQKFVKDEKFVNNVTQYRFKHQYIEGVYSDIYDGAVYKKYFLNDGVLSSQYNFSYNFFVDGIAYSKSGHKTIWPIYLTINELPYEERKNYYILAAVYCGDQEPKEQWFFPAFVAQANKLSVNGFKWSHRGENVTSRVIPLCLIADSGARSHLINMQSYSAVYGCTFCYIQSQKILGAQRFLMKANQAPAPERSLDSYKFDLAEVEKRKGEVQEKNRVFRGVKGNCVLGSLLYFSVIDSCPVDYFHCLLIGVTKRHMELLLMPRNKSFWNNMRREDAMTNLIASIDDGIKKIQSTTSVIRGLRPLKDIANWKASEFRSWLLFYCVVCLKGFLKEKHLELLAMLSKAASFLLQKTVIHYHIETAFRLFKLYSFYFQETFGDQNVSYNIHLLSHIPKGVLSFGPLWTHNSFSYESKNSLILQLCKSPHHVPLQVARKFLTYQSLPIVCSELARCKETVLFSEKLLNYKHLVKYDRANRLSLMQSTHEAQPLAKARTAERRWRNHAQRSAAGETTHSAEPLAKPRKDKRNDNNCVLLGKPTSRTLSKNDIEKLSMVLQCCASNECLMYDRMYYKKKKYSTEKYGLDKKSNDSYAFLDSGECVKILHILKDNVANRVVLNCKIMKIVGKPVIQIPDARFDHVVRAIDCDDKLLVNIERLDRPCYRFQLPSKQYIANIPYACTVE
ncbi:SPbeta prophage-derived putative integrase/recombinase [Frankliniella fusca]|uniref:SPbeta prophage-derived putative integrase/recombinase n=1 Tax=Frankliniella fusca TaxID=407009 RepID=A0AAE1HC28_9NEOP|nr:SPbeta prophage-derived putative integrase/recombinase [Frankliniella fusca]